MYQWVFRIDGVFLGLRAILRERGAQPYRDREAALKSGRAEADADRQHDRAAHRRRRAATSASRPRGSGCAPTRSRTARPPPRTPATSSAVCTLAMRNGSVWKMPPSVVIPPVIEPRTTAEPRPSLLACVRQRLRPAHAHARPQRRREAHEQRRVRVRRDRGREDRRQRGHRAVDQAHQRRLDHAQARSRARARSLPGGSGG